ncbi:alpha-amylase family glycosyl hydrolase [Pseudoclostridium thermosuccinogenes]|uniref:alpha-amylase family glycosyl hydrolase n=1 Tax=Clostridium thermosuccinogenes TaxID=84032 RepID=UPI002FDA2E4A
MIMALVLLAGCHQQKQGDELGNEPPEQIQETAPPHSEPEQAQEMSEPRPKTVYFPDVTRKERVIDSKYGIYYEIFVRSFADSDGDGIGDFKGLTRQLDYLKDDSSDEDLNVDGIWLMPVNASPSYHKYDVTDYYSIDPEYGTMEDFEHFLAEAHKRGLKVIMDLVINHTSSQHPWFIESCKPEDNPYRDYYRWAKTDQEGYNLKGKSPWGSNTWHKKGDSYYYGIFWDQMPDLNYDNPKVRQEIKNIAKFWLEKGVDGFRLDAALHIYGAHENPVGTDYQKKNLQWWKEFGAYVEEVNPKAYLVGEVWDKTSVVAPYYQGLDSLFNFDVGEGIIKAVNSGTGAAVSSKGFARWLEEKYADFTKVERNFLDAPFLTNHDQNRSMNQLGKDVGKAKLAAGIYLTLPGNPFIYYGEEIGMLGTKPDERIREPFVWSKEREAPQTYWEANLQNTDTVPVKEQQEDPNSLLNCYKQLIALRQSSKALKMGDFKALDSGSSRVIAYSRNYDMDGKDKESVMVLHNLSSEFETFELIGEDFKDLKVIFETPGPEKSTINQSAISLAPRTTLVLQK